MENEERKEITFGRILKVAFLNWKLFIPVAVVVAVGCALGIKFGYNSMKGSYSSTFSYSSVDLANEKYADGSKFVYANLIKYDSLKRVKDSNEKYSFIDIDKMVEKDGISITTNINEKTNEHTYTINLAYKYIKNGDIAKSFIKDIAELALDKDADIVNNSSFDNALVLFDEADTFENQIKYLARQASFLTSSYSTLAAESNLPISVTEQASANKEKVSLIVDSNFVRNMTYTVNSNGYVKDYTSQEAKNFDVTISLLTKEQAENEVKIDKLTDKMKEVKEAAAISDLKELATLIVRNEDIQVELDSLALKKSYEGAAEADVPGLTAFKADLATYRSKLASATTDYKSVIKSAYIEGAEVNYGNSSAIKLNGTIGIVINVAISLVAGVVVGAVVNLIVDRKKLYE